MEHVRSYYAASAHAAPLREPLRGEATADVCVVGGGIAGCSTALNLAERGYKVVLLEGKRVGWGASGRSGGQAIFGFAAGQDKLVAQVGRETARRMFDVSVEALDVLKDRVARHAIDCDLNWGQMHVAIKPRHETELKAWREELARDYGYSSLTWLDRARSGRCWRPALHRRPARFTQRAPASAQLHARPGARCRRRGRADFRGQPGHPAGPRRHRGREDRWRRVRARHVALCCNAYIDDRSRRSCAPGSCRSAPTSSRPSGSARRA